PSRLMGGRVGARTKLDYAVDGALGLAYAALTAGDRVGMVVFDREVRGHLRPRAHRRALGLFVELLRGTEAHAVEADYRALAREVGARQRRRALVVVLTDFVEVDAASLVAPLVLLARRHRVLLVALRDRAYEALAPTAPLGADGPLDLYRRIVLDQLLREGEERDGAGEEEQGGVHGLAQRPPPALPSRPGDGAAEAEPGGGAERDRGQLGDAVGQDPGEEVEGERVAEEDRGEGPEHDPV